MEGWGRDRPGVVNGVTFQVAVPINACVIMDNMIIENNHEQNMAYGFYQLMGQIVRSCNGGERIARFLEAYHSIRHLDVHDNHQEDLIYE
jgi:hypothetical protein